MANEKVILEREYNVPLRKGWLKSPKYKRSKKAVSVLREFLQRHMKSEDIRLGAHVNEYIWKDGIKSPPHHVSVKATKTEDGVVRAELLGHEFKGAVKALPKKEEATGLKGKLQEAIADVKGEESEKVEKSDDKVEETVSKETKAKSTKKEAEPKSSE